MAMDFSGSCADFAWGALYVVNDEAGNPHVCIDGKEIDVDPEGFHSVTFPGEDGEGDRRLDIGRNQNCEPVITYTVPAKDAQGREGVHEITIVIHRSPQIAGFSVIGPQFVRPLPAVFIIGIYIVACIAFGLFIGVLMLALGGSNIRD